MALKIKNSLIDADIIAKIGSFTGEKLLCKILMSLQCKLFIHEYLVNEELILPGLAKEQFLEMINMNQITIIHVSDLSSNEIIEYESASQVLATEMDIDLHKKRDRNTGEVKSMAMAYAKGYGFFVSDDRDARVAAKKCLQNLDGTYLNTIRMKDIITHIYENDSELKLGRKTAKRLYVYTANARLSTSEIERQKIEKIHRLLVKEFDEKLWPLEVD